MTGTVAIGIQDFKDLIKKDYFCFDRTIFYKRMMGKCFWKI